MPTPAKRTSTSAKAVKATKAVKPAKAVKTANKASGSTHDVGSALAWLEEHATEATREGMSRFGIVATNPLGVTVGDIRKLGKQIGKDHALATSLWETDVYEARMLACFVDDPELVTRAQMDRWCRDFDNWAICDTACFHLFDRTELAFDRVVAWATRSPEFEKRAAFALLASLALHRKDVAPAEFERMLPWIAAAANDERNFVKKAVSWALRGIGQRRGLRDPALALAERLAASSDRTERWVGKDALREFAKKKARS